jgi:hypothetical protein
MVHLGQFVEPGIRHGDNPDIRIDGTKGIIGDSTPALVMALKNVLLPTLGKPTIPRRMKVLLINKQRYYGRFSASVQLKVLCRVAGASSGRFSPENSTSGGLLPIRPCRILATFVVRIHLPAHDAFC